MTIKIYEALDIINFHVSEGVKIAPNELYRIDEKYIKLDDLRETDKLSAEKLQEQLNTAKKYIEHVIGTIKHDGHLGNIQTDWILPDLEKALAAIGGDDD
ncbi:hypothetical protein LL045_08100 [Lactococcus lactis subsp. lactis]|uniref:hypothetical protein n=1 Tax=Lactococcus lactis TaxID=1358 RepID=UPI00374A7A2A